MNTKTKELVIISKEVSPIVQKAQELKIKDDESLKVAVEFLSILNKENDRLVEDREKLTKPLNEALKGIRAKYKPAVDILEKGIDLIRDKMSEYQTALLTKKRLKEEKIAADVAAGKISMEKGLDKIDNIKEVSNNTKTEAGSIQFRTDYVLEVVNKEEIPMIYLKVDESAVTKALKEGMIVPGAKLVEKIVPINRR